jgi:serine/threonine-protein kinase
VQQVETQKGTTRQRYQIVKKIDAGGMAEIYLGAAESIEGIKRQVAIKRILPNLTKNTQFVDMFLDEARLSMLLTHANIVQVFDVGKSGQTYFLVMEYVDGYNLRRVFQKAVDTGVRVPLEVACFVMMEVCKGLAYAHDRVDDQGKHLRIVHRDLSPPNILLGKSGEAKITDFGLAKAMTQLSITDPGVVKGKFSYLSPEACEGNAVDHRADIFAAGIVLWEILANRRLFLGKTDLATVELVKKAQVPPLAGFNPQVTAEFEQIIQRSLNRDPRKRYTTAQEFGEALANYLFARNLKVTGYDVGRMLTRLFGAEGGATEHTEEIIAGLLQEEVLNLAVLNRDQLGGSDGSQPLDADGFEVAHNPVIDFHEFWTNLGLPLGTGLPGNGQGTPGLFGDVQSPGDLARALEGDDETSRAPSPAASPNGPKPAAQGKSKLWLGLVILVVVLGGAAAGAYFMDFF